MQVEPRDKKREGASRKETTIHQKRNHTTGDRCVEFGTGGETVRRPRGWRTSFCLNPAKWKKLPLENIGGLHQPQPGGNGPSLHWEIESSREGAGRRGEKRRQGEIRVLEGVGAGNYFSKPILERPERERLEGTTYLSDAKGRKWNRASPKDGREDGKTGCQPPGLTEG